MPVIQSVVQSSDSLGINGLTLLRDDRCIFENLHFQVDAGEILLIKGRNGAGKTSLLKILIGLHRDFSGEVFWNGQSLHNLEEVYRQQLLYVGHAAGVKSTLTVFDNLWFYVKLASNHLEKTALKLQIRETLTHLKLFDFIDTPCFQLSAGQQRRVALARLWLSEYFKQHSLWILDEPFNNLDHDGHEALLTLIEKFVANKKAVILTSHLAVHFNLPVKCLHLPSGEIEVLQ